MTSPAARVPVPSRTVWTSAVVLFVIGVVLHAVAVDQRTLWYDESATVIGAGRSFAQLGELVRHVDLVHAAYYALMHLWFDVVGSSAFTIRLPSAVAAAAAAALMVPLGARLVSVRVGVLSGAVLLVLPATAFGATNGRSGMCQVLAAVAASTVLVVVLDRVRDTTAGLGRIWLPSAAYVVVAALAIALQLWFVFVVVAHAVVAVLVLGARGRPPVARLAPVATAFVVLAVATLPFALAASHQSAQVSWLRAPDVTGVLTTLWRDESFSVGLVERSAVGASVTASVGWVLAAVGGARLFRRHREGFWSVALWWAVPPVGLLLVSAAGSPRFLRPVPRLLRAGLRAPDGRGDRHGARRSARPCAPGGCAGCTEAVMARPCGGLRAGSGAGGRRCAGLGPRPVGHADDPGLEDRRRDDLCRAASRGPERAGLRRAGPHGFPTRGRLPGGAAGRRRPDVRWVGTALRRTLACSPRPRRGRGRRRRPRRRLVRGFERCVAPRRHGGAPRAALPGR
ncbi:hypothetical protein [Curtobacterium sp. MCJR17_043]|uniref:hypothetical protein n=1 Tax=Curtobacterium sp. MCJR17_043 TaxID=2175660 RepID=UPI0024E01EFC|nr:hypothetical protein [Curtobacterium sp. MCJR17_043]WIB35526.1 hypothetical protein DEJ15_15130 [Curtobacterium sp. MCJR17_043]